MNTLKLEELTAELTAVLDGNRKMRRLIETTIPTMHGWCTVEKALALAGLVLREKPKLIYEIGVWAGRSLLPMAWAAQTYGGKVIGIDSWSAKVSSENEYGSNAKWWGEQDHDAIYQLAMEFVKRFGLEDTVTLLRKKSDDVEPMECGLVHIDGSHVEQAVRDAERYGAKVIQAGYAVLDDLTWVGGSVLRAIDSLEDMGFTEVFRFQEQNWNIMQRVR